MRLAWNSEALTVSSSNAPARAHASVGGPHRTFQELHQEDDSNIESREWRRESRTVAVRTVGCGRDAEALPILTVDGSQVCSSDRVEGGRCDRPYVQMTPVVECLDDEGESRIEAEAGSDPSP